MSTRIAIEGTTNLRDLGGYPARDGKKVAARRLYRAEALTRPGATAKVAIWSDANLAAYRELGLRTVIDLRATTEVESAPSAWAHASNAALVLLPVNEGGEGDATDFVRQLRNGSLRAFSADDLARYYATTIRARARVFGLALEQLSVPTHLPALVHCTAGKDRTGLLIALTLELLGVPRQIVVDDYALTGVFRPNRVLAYADVLAQHAIPPAAVNALFDSPSRAMAALLKGLDAEFGSVETFVRERAGVTTQTLDGLAHGLLI